MKKKITLGPALCVASQLPGGGFTDVEDAPEPDQNLMMMIVISRKGPNMYCT